MSPIADNRVLMPSPAPTRLRWRLAALCESALLHSTARRLCRLFGDDRHGGAVILMYHSVPDVDTRPWVDPRNTTDPVVFERQMKFLAAHRRVVPLTALAAELEHGRSLEPGSVVLTFDGGYLDNYAVAAPILASLGLPATFFVATGYIERGAPQWIDALYSMYLARTEQALHLDATCELSLALDSFSRVSFDLRVQHDVDTSHARLCELLLEADFYQRRHLLAAVRSQLRPVVEPPRLTMNWEEVRALQAMHAGFDIGVHTRDHLSLPMRSPARIGLELTRCIDDVREHTGAVPRLFSFPYGRCSASARQLASTRFRAAVVADPPALVDGDT
ncbi:MAG TPA: polysaccharide deacetylase family protein, partial [Planctomycetota bacterium]|nr:polysaccharide deacetylase family protein [Planctomycetota bacterium]